MTFLAVIGCGCAGGFLGGIVGVAIGIDSKPWELSPDNWALGAVFGSILGLFPALVIAMVSTMCLQVKTNRHHLLAALGGSAFLSFLGVIPVVAPWVGGIVGC